MRKKPFVFSVSSAENGVIVTDRMAPEHQYVFPTVRGLYEWLCEQTEETAKADSYTHDGRVVVNANKYDALKEVALAAETVCGGPYSSVSSLKLLHSLQRLRGVE